jgi:hypothetical protein
VGPTTLPIKNKNVTNLFNELQTWMDSLGRRHVVWNIVMKSGIRNIRRLYRSGSQKNCQNKRFSGSTEGQMG